MPAQSVKELLQTLDGVVAVDGEAVTVVNEAGLPDKAEMLAHTAVFGPGLTRETARWLLWEIGQAVGVYPASIHELYLARGRGEVPPNFTVPAMNIRAINFYASRAVFRAAQKLGVGAMIFEIARSEMGYTDQRPAEYVASLLAAALKEGFRGPLFIQGDHIQVSAKNYGQDAQAEIGAVKELIDEAVAAGFYNIDIDTSTLVDLSFPTLDEQQRANYAECAALTRHVRSIEPAGITVSLGGEIGEVGHKNSTVEELVAFMDGYRRELGDLAGISKISVQTGTSHGGVVLPDGTLADVKVDFDTLRDLGRAAREYGCGGAVQHGASTLPPEAFGKFPEVETLEIHLATNFQNIIYDHLPTSVVDEAYDYVRTQLKKEWKESQTEEQFLYSTRKKAIGPFKRQWWNLAETVLNEIGQALQSQFEFLFQRLNVVNTRHLATRYGSQVVQHRPRPVRVEEQEALKLASDLAD